jgi:hypothetical protein
MYSYIGKNPESGETKIVQFHTSQEANCFGLEKINNFPDYRIIFTGEDDLSIRNNILSEVTENLNQNESAHRRPIHYTGGFVDLNYF